MIGNRMFGTTMWGSTGVIGPFIPAFKGRLWNIQEEIRFESIQLELRFHSIEYEDRISAIQARNERERVNKEDRRHKLPEDRDGE